MIVGDIGMRLLRSNDSIRKRLHAIKIWNLNKVRGAILARSVIGRTFYRTAHKYGIYSMEQHVNTAFRP